MSKAKPGSIINARSLKADLSTLDSAIVPEPRYLIDCDPGDEQPGTRHDNPRSEFMELHALFELS